MQCYQGVTWYNIVGAFIAIGNTTALTNYSMFTLVFFLQDKHDNFDLKKEAVLTEAAWLIFLSYPFSILSSFICGFLYNKIGLKIPVFFGFVICTSGMLILPFFAKTLMPGIYLCLCAIQFGTSMVSSAPLLNDCIKPYSIMTALIVASFMRTLGTLAAIGGLFYFINSLKYQVQFPIAAGIFFSVGMLSVILMRSHKSIDTTTVSSRS